MRTQFTFYESFYKAISRIKKKSDRADAYDIICAYALSQEEPNLDSVSDAVAIAFELLRPVLDKAREKAESGKSGGRKPKANAKQAESKTEANSNLEKAASKKEKEIEIEKEIDNIHPTDVCAELPSSPPPAAVLPLVDGSDFPIAQKTVDELSGLYPAVDIEQQLRNMRGWLLANPKNRKTKAGIMRFVNSWLSREQNRTRPQNQQQFQGGTKAKELDKFYGMAADWVSNREVTG